MGSRPGLAEYIASFEAANNAPHGFVLLLAGAAYAVQALNDALGGLLDRPQSPARPLRRRERPQHPGRGVRRRGSARRRRGHPDGDAVES